MPMGMRGSAMGGGNNTNQMQSRLPPSLQAKMDKVSVCFVFHVLSIPDHLSSIAVPIGSEGRKGPQLVFLNFTS